MKALVTGGTKGFGAEFVSLCGNDSKGVSRSNGYDIQSALDRKKIVSLSLEYDVFFNFAHSGHFEGQTSLLYELFAEWKAENKTGYVFNMGSIATYYPPKKYLRYSIIKKGLEFANQQCCKAIENGEVNFRMTNFRCGMLSQDGSPGVQPLQLFNLMSTLYLSSPKLFVADMVVV